MSDTIPAAQHNPKSVHPLWHHDLHPSVKKHASGNALPNIFFGRAIHPTHAVLSHPTAGLKRWNSRHHRKNRHILETPTSGLLRAGRNVWMGLGHLTRLEYWNISWWVAVSFTLGSVVWVINGFIVFLPLANPRVPLDMSAAGWSAWVGATIFEVGAIMGVLEAWNRDDTANFGWGVETSLRARTRPSRDHEKSRIGNPKDSSSRTQDLDPDSDSGPADSDTGLEKPARRWKWFSADPKYWRELGFLAAAVQCAAATIFWISGFTGLPQIFDAIEPKPGLLDGVYWTPQVVGGSGFIVSS
ncbi:hypothetical protein HGRIS_000203 [Hohenbuehelia grisea]